MRKSESSVRSIAAKAGVSPTTTWKVITGRGGLVMPALKARVMRVIEEMKREEFK
jgi:DNA-binding LacI/PurR family transcriptional regulator